MLDLIEEAILENGFMNTFNQESVGFTRIRG
jgi:hypothetical protein